MSSWISPIALEGFFGLLLMPFYILASWSPQYSVSFTKRKHAIHINIIRKKKKVHVADFLIAGKSRNNFMHSSRSFFPIFLPPSHPPSLLIDILGCIDFGHRACISKTCSAVHLAIKHVVSPLQWTINIKTST